MKKWFILGLFLALFFIPCVEALSTGWITASTTEFSDANWQNTSNITKSDNSFATATFGTPYLYARNFSFDKIIPEGWIIDSVRLIVETQETNYFQEYIKLLSDGLSTPNIYTDSNTPKYNTTANLTNFLGYYTPYNTTLTNRWTRNRLLNNTFYMRIERNLAPGGGGGGFATGSKIFVWDEKGTFQKKVEDVKVGDLVLGWNMTTGYNVATITNATLFPPSKMYKIIVEYPHIFQELCDYFKNLKISNDTIYAEYNLNLSRCYKDLSVSSNHLIWLPYKQKKVTADKLTTDDYLSGLYFNVSKRPYNSSNFVLYPSKIVKIIEYTGENVHIESNSDFIFVHELMTVFLKDTSYVDWVGVEVEYSLDTWVVDHFVSAGINLYGSVEEAKGRGILKKDTPYAGDKWYGETWTFEIGNTTRSGTITSATVRIYNIKADSNPNSDTFAIECSNDDGISWYTLWTGTDLPVIAETQNYNAITLCNVDTWDEVNKTRIRITSTAKSGAEDSVLWYVDAIHLIVETEAPPPPAVAKPFKLYDCIILRKFDYCYNMQNMTDYKIILKKGIDLQLEIFCFKENWCYDLVNKALIYLKRLI